MQKQSLFLCVYTVHTVFSNSVLHIQYMFYVYTLLYVEQYKPYIIAIPEGNLSFSSPGFGIHSNHYTNMHICVQDILYMHVNKHIYTELKFDHFIITVKSILQ